jgi:N-acetylmuramic acid 6-phosphate etherase
LLRAKSRPVPATGSPAAAGAGTEGRNPRTELIDAVPTLALLRMLNEQDALVAPAVASVLPELAVVVDATVLRLEAGGSVHYFGAGSSGRIGVLDAAEVVPTFGVGPGVFVAHHAGGSGAVAVPAENAEDDAALGESAAAGLGPGDVAVGLTASGQTPFVAGALRAAGAAGALTVLVTSNPAAPLAELAEHCLVTDTGPEAIAGSTRLKASTAQKLVLNALSTAVMVRLGRTYSNLMIGVAATNAKLAQRQVTILMQASGAEAGECRAELARCDGDLRLALVCLLSGESAGASRVALARARGVVRDALAALGSDRRPEISPGHVDRGAGRS